ncbi:MAG: gamma-glutamyl-gamma-aminobutyrate hydrolase family protein [Candidatus Neomarinimicrobiota bacterium]
MERPVIGIPVSPPEDGSPYYNLNPQYSNAIWRAGGDPLALPLLPEEAYAQRMIALVDGLVLPGSKYDLDPALYGEPPHEQAAPPYYDRDDLDRNLLALAYEQCLPVLGICHGSQAINVFRGGTLIQDIQAEVPGAIKHRTPSGAGETAHEVVLQADSVLNPDDQPVTASTNSAHHQAADHLGQGLRAIATSSDGLIEAFEGTEPARHFVLAVQWHPERSAATDPLAVRIFAATLGAAAKWRAARGK